MDKENNIDFGFTPYTIDEDTRNALFAGSELTEEVSANIVEIFEAAVSAKAKEIHEQAEEVLAEAIEANAAELSEQVSNYLEDVVVPEWLEENQIAIERSFISESNASLVESLVDLLSQHNINVFADESDVYDSMNEELEDMRQTLEEMAEVVEAQDMQIKGAACMAIVDELSEELSESQKEKFLSLVEDYSIENPEAFQRRAETVLSAFVAKKSEVMDDITEEVDSAAPALKTRNEILASRLW